MKCLILAAGRGQRLSGHAFSKPLCQLKGRPLIDWVIRAGLLSGVREFVVVTGYAAEAVEGHVREAEVRDGFKVRFVRNEEWQKENGLSVLKAKDAVGPSFILSMSDHIYDPALLAELKSRTLDEGETVLAVDLRVRNNPFVDLDDVTKVRHENGLIREIGKSLRDYNAFDTGVFLSSEGLFQALEESQRRGDFTLSGGMRILAAGDKARIADIGERLWIDVDDPACLTKAAAVLERIDTAAFPDNTRT